MLKWSFMLSNDHHHLQEDAHNLTILYDWMLPWIQGWLCMLLVASGTLSLQPRFSFYRPVTTTKKLKLESASAFVSSSVQCRMTIAHTCTRRSTQLHYVIIYTCPKIEFSYWNRFLRSIAIGQIRRLTIIKFSILCKAYEKIHLVYSESGSSWLRKTLLTKAARETHVSKEAIHIHTVNR